MKILRIGFVVNKTAGSSTLKSAIGGLPVTGESRILSNLAKEYVKSSVKTHGQPDPPRGQAFR
jgi:hypothetical protein